MIEKDFTNMTGKLLIASPYAMESNIFHKSLIYVISHSEKGAAGLIINRPMQSLPINNLIKQIDQSVILPELNLDVHLGGPVELERGFFLHSNDYDKNLLFKPEDRTLLVSSNTQIIEDMANNSGPKNTIFIIGYTGWTSGQLEYEIENNLWIASNPIPELIFAKETNIKWELCLASQGVDHREYISTIGNC